MFSYVRIAILASVLTVALGGCQIAVPALLAGAAVAVSQMAEQCNAPEAECAGNEKE